ncbi:MAG: 2-oxoglutarate dehydrogenase E1 subunit family protein, partial [Acidimicrobiia bacterium]
MTDEQGDGDLGLNTGLVEDLYRQWVENRDSLPPAWAALFEGRERATSAPAAPRGNGAGDGLPTEGQTQSPAATPLRGAPARLVANMEA